MSPIITRDSVLLTGGAGFIGANLVNRLLDLGYENINLIIKESTDISRLKNILPKVKLNKIDLLDKNLKDFVRKINPSIIFHLATYSAYADQKAVSEMVDANIRGTLNLLISTQDIDYKVFVNTGSSSEYGIKKNAIRENDLLEPISFYAATKASATLLCQVFASEYQKPVVTLRPFSVFGPLEEKKRFIPTIINAIIQNQSIRLTAGDQRRDFIFIDDIVDIYIKTISKGGKLSGQILNMGTGIEYTNDEVAQTLFKVTGKKVPIKKGAYPKRLWDTPHWVADTSKIKKYLNWKPKFSLEQGLGETYRWYINKYAK